MTEDKVIKVNELNLELIAPSKGSRVVSKRALVL
jgi:hypothetical protein